MSLDELIHKLNKNGVYLLGTLMYDSSLVYCFFPLNRYKNIDWDKYTYINPGELKQYINSLLEELDNR